MQQAELIAQLAPRLSGALIATDFDGTLAPLVLDPADSRPAPGAIAALIGLAGRGAQVAVVTGRDAQTVVRLGGLAAVPRLVVAGLYGLETWAGGRLTSPGTPPAITTLRERLPITLAAAGVDPAIWIEDKRLSLVVHSRRAADPEQALAQVHGAVAELADDLELELHPGSGVLELRLPGFDKARVIAQLVAAHDPTAVLYLGDDLGDLPAFAEMRRLRATGTPAWGVAVVSSGVPEVAEAADVLLPDARAAVDLFAALIG